MSSEYFLDYQKYTLGNALFWGNSYNHLQKSTETGLALPARVFHFALFVAELLPIISQIISLFENFVVYFLHTTKLVELADKEIKNKISEVNDKISSNTKINETSLKVIEIDLNLIKFDKVTQDFIAAEDKRQFLNDLLKCDPEKVHQFLSNWIKTVRSNKEFLDYFSSIKSERFESFNRFNKRRKELLKKTKFEGDNALLGKDLPIIATFIFQNLSIFKEKLANDFTVNKDDLISIKTLFMVHFEDGDSEFETTIFNSFLSKNYGQDVQTSVNNLKCLSEIYGNKFTEFFVLSLFLVSFYPEKDQDSVKFILEVVLEYSEEIFNESAPRIIEKYIYKYKESLKLIEWLLANRNEDQLRVFIDRNYKSNNTYDSFLNLLVLKKHLTEFKLIRDNPKYRKFFSEFNEFDNGKTTEQLTSLDRLVMIFGGDKTALAPHSEINQISVSSHFLKSAIECVNLENLMKELMEPMLFGIDGGERDRGYLEIILDLQLIGKNNFDLLKKMLLQPFAENVIQSCELTGKLWPAYPNGIQWLLNTRHCGYENGKEELKNLFKLIYKQDRNFLIDCCLAEDPYNDHLNVLSRVFINKNFNCSACNQESLKGPLYYNIEWVSWFESLAKEVKKDSISPFFESLIDEMKLEFFKLCQSKEGELNQFKNAYQNGEKTNDEYLDYRKKLSQNIRDSFFNFMREILNKKIEDSSDISVEEKNELIRQITQAGFLQEIVENCVSKIEKEHGSGEEEGKARPIDSTIKSIINEFNANHESLNDLVEKYKKIPIPKSEDENLIITLRDRSYGVNDFKNIQRCLFELKKSESATFPLFSKLCEWTEGHLCLDNVPPKRIKNPIGLADAHVKTVSLSGLEGEWAPEALKVLYNTYIELETIEIHRKDLKNLKDAFKELLAEGKRLKIQIRLLDHPRIEKLAKEDHFQDFIIKFNEIDYHFNAKILECFGLLEQAKSLQSSSNATVEEWNSFKNRVDLAYQGIIEINTMNLEAIYESIDKEMFNFSNEDFTLSGENDTKKLEKINTFFNENDHILFVKNDYFENLFSGKFDGKFSIEDEEWFPRVVNHPDLLRAVFVYLFENRIKITNQNIVSNLLYIANIWQDSTLKSMLTIECARNHFDCNQYDLYSSQMQEGELRKEVFENIRKGFKNKDFQSFQIRLLDLHTLYEKLSEEEKNEIRELNDFSIDNQKFSSSILNLYGLMSEAHELVDMAKKNNTAFTIFQPFYKYNQPKEFYRKYKLAETKGILEITPQNIDKIESEFEKGGFTTKKIDRDGSHSLAEKYLEIPKDVLFLKSSYFRKHLKDENLNEFCITGEKWYVDNAQRLEVLEALLIYIYEDRFPEEVYSKEVIDQMQVIVSEWENC